MGLCDDYAEMRGDFDALAVAIDSITVAVMANAK